MIYLFIRSPEQQLGQIRATHQAGLSDEYRTSLLLSFFLSFSHLSSSSSSSPGLQFHQLTSRWQRFLTKPQLSSSGTGTLLITPNKRKKKRSFDVFAVRLCLKTYCCFTVEGLLLFHTHTHIWMCLLFHLTTSPISHLGSAPPPWGRTLNYISMTSFFFFFPFNQLYL